MGRKWALCACMLRGRPVGGGEREEKESSNGSSHLEPWKGMRESPKEYAAKGG